jgi:sigma-E factor negative regulatory protein RseA
MKTRISEWMDGEMDAGAADDLIRAAGRGGEAGEAWRTYHLIGDAMRGGRPLSEDFEVRVAARLAAEPTVLAPARARPAPRAWLAMSAAASVAAVALVGWVAFGPLQEPALAPAPVALVAPKPALEPVAVSSPIPAEDNDYLLAHQLYSPRLSLQGMAPYVRSVSSER